MLSSFVFGPEEIKDGEKETEERQHEHEIEIHNSPPF